MVNKHQPSNLPVSPSARQMLWSPPSPPPEGRCSPDTGGAAGRQSSASALLRNCLAGESCLAQGHPSRCSPHTKAALHRVESGGPLAPTQETILVQGTLWSQLGSSLRLCPARFRPGPIPLPPFLSSAVGAQSSPSTNILHVAPRLELASQGTQASHFL